MVCLVHCLLTPILFAVVPVGASLGFWHHGFHQTFLIIVPFVALFAFIPGWRRHRDWRVWQWGGTGIFLLAIGVAVTEVFEHASAMTLVAEIVLTILGGACLIRAHLLNRELCVCCDHGHMRLRSDV